VVDELHVVSSDELTSFTKAERSPSWRKAMMEEMDPIEENDTWSLVDLPPGCKPIGVKWVFKVKQSASDILLSQGAYAMKILEMSDMTGCNPCHVPMEARLKLSKQSTQALVDAIAYQSIVGSLRYLVNTRPDLAFAVGYVSHFLEEP
jgi:hypothetical protein